MLRDTTAPVAILAISLIIHLYATMRQQQSMQPSMQRLINAYRGLKLAIKGFYKLVISYKFVISSYTARHSHSGDSYWLCVHACMKDTYFVPSAVWYGFGMDPESFMHARRAGIYEWRAI